MSYIPLYYMRNPISDLKENCVKIYWTNFIVFNTSKVLLMSDLLISLTHISQLYIPYYSYYAFFCINCMYNKKKEPLITVFNMLCAIRYLYHKI